MNNKKHLKLSLFCVSVIIFICFCVNFIEIKRNSLSNLNPLILINICSPNGENIKEVDNNSKITLYSEKKTFYKTGDNQEKILYSIYGKNKRYYLILRDGYIKILCTDFNDKKLDEYILDDLPVALYNCDDNLFVLSEKGDLYYVDFFSKSLKELVNSIETGGEYTKPEIFISKIGIVYRQNKKNGWYLYSEGNIKKISNCEKCFGFTGEDTLLFGKSYQLLFVLYQKNITSGHIFNIRPIIEKTGIFNGTLSGDGRYLFVYYGMNECGSYPKIYDLSSFANKTFSEYEYPAYSLQWLDNTADSTVCSAEG